MHYLGSSNGGQLHSSSANLHPSSGTVHPHWCHISPQSGPTLVPHCTGLEDIGWVVWPLETLEHLKHNLLLQVDQTQTCLTSAQHLMSMSDSMQVQTWSRETKGENKAKDHYCKYKQIQRVIHAT